MFYLSQTAISLFQTELNYNQDSILVKGECRTGKLLQSILRQILNITFFFNTYILLFNPITEASFSSKPKKVQGCLRAHSELTEVASELISYILTHTS